jgi:hypothetical protein
MKGYRRYTWLFLLLLGCLVIGLVACAGLQPKPTANIEVTPVETAITPALLKQPIQFKGSGFMPKETVVIDLMIPKGVKIKTVAEDEKSVGLAVADADENGNFDTKMGAVGTLNWLFQVGWTNNFKPKLDEATPLPPGKYEIKATGMDSDKFGLATLTIVPPPKKKE